MSAARLLLGDCREVLRSLPAESVHCVVTSPPYWALRSYLDADDPLKPLEIGLEDRPEECVEKLVTVFREARRVLRVDGTLFLNVGDVYLTEAGTVGEHPGGGRQVAAAKGRIAKTPPNRRRVPGLKRKDLVGFPWMLAFALRADGWWLRSEIIWHKTSALPESVEDRAPRVHEQVFLLARSERYFYDRDAVRQPHAPGTLTHRGGGSNGRVIDGQDKVAAAKWAERAPVRIPDPRGAALRTVWSIPTYPFKGEHYATFPPALAERCILLGTSERGCCPACGASWTRVLEDRPAIAPEPGGGKHGTPEQAKAASRVAARVRAARAAGADHDNPFPPRKTIGWSPSCSCAAGDPVPCTVLDPFGGAGTVAMVALRLGRDAISIDLDAKSVEIARRRIAEDRPSANVEAPTPLALRGDDERMPLFEAPSGGPTAVPR